MKRGRVWWERGIADQRQMACQSHGKMDNMNSVNHVIFIVDTSRSMRKNDAVTPGADKAVSRIEAVRRELHRFCMHQQASKLYNRDLYSIWLFEETRRCVVSCVDVGVATEAVNTLEITPQSGTSYQAGELYLQMPKRCLSLYLGVQCSLAQLFCMLCPLWAFPVVYSCVTREPNLTLDVVSSY